MSPRAASIPGTPGAPGNKGLLKGLPDPRPANAVGEDPCKSAKFFSFRAGFACCKALALSTRNISKEDEEEVVGGGVEVDEDLSSASDIPVALFSNLEKKRGQNSKVVVSLMDKKKKTIKSKKPHEGGHSIPIIY